MTGTERAALRAMLGALRRDGGAWPGVLARRISGAINTYAIRDVAHAIDAAQWQCVPPRLLRARAALYLRAVLRAEAGDCGRWWVAEVVDERGEVVRRRTGYVLRGTYEMVRCACAYTTRESAEDAAAQMLEGLRRHGPGMPGVRAVVRHARPLWLDAPQHRSEP